MKNVISLNRDKAAENLDVREWIVSAMANNGWRHVDNGTVVDIDVATLRKRSNTVSNLSFCFDKNGERWYWKAFHALDAELVRDGRSKHCIDLAVELLGEEAVATKISEALKLNEFGFSQDDYMPNGKFMASEFERCVIKHAGPWRVFQAQSIASGGVYGLYRYDSENKVYKCWGQTDVARLCRKIEPLLPASVARRLYDALLTSDAIPIADEIYTQRIMVSNGKLLDLRTMELYDSDDSIFVTSKLKARWDETDEKVAETYASEGGKMAMKLLESIEDEQDRKVLLQYFAYMLTPGFHLKKILILYGNSNCGKSTAIYAFTDGVCSSDMCVAFDPGRTFGGRDGSRFGLQKLIGKRIGQCDEWGAYRMPDDGPLKTIVDGGKVDIDVKSHEPISVNLPCKFIAATNNIPNLQDDMGASNGRFILLDLSREPFDPAKSPNFRLWYDNEDFSTVVLREAVKALNNKEDDCWQEEAGVWYVHHIAEPSEKSQELLTKMRNDSNGCLDVIAAMLTGGTEETEVPQMLGKLWSELANAYTNVYFDLNHNPPGTTTIRHINRSLIGTKIGGKLYQIHESGVFTLPGHDHQFKKRVFYEHSYDTDVKLDNIRKAGMWNYFARNCHGDEGVFAQWLIGLGFSDYVDTCLQWIREIECETIRLHEAQDESLSIR